MVGGVVVLLLGETAVQCLDSSLRGSPEWFQCIGPQPHCLSWSFNPTHVSCKIPGTSYRVSLCAYNGSHTGQSSACLLWSKPHNVIKSKEPAACCNCISNGWSLVPLVSLEFPKKAKMGLQSHSKRLDLSLLNPTMVSCDYSPSAMAWFIKPDLGLGSYSGKDPAGFPWACSTEFLLANMTLRISLFQLSWNLTLLSDSLSPHQSYRRKVPIKSHWNHRNFQVNMVQLMCK